MRWMMLGRWTILAATIAAVVGMIAFKVTTERAIELAPLTDSDLPVLYLFHDPTDQDPECQQIYALADRAERELGAQLAVRRPDVERQSEFVDQFQVRVLPTIVLVSPTGAIKERFEGEGDVIATRIEQALRRVEQDPAWLQ